MHDGNPIPDDPAPSNPSLPAARSEGFDDPSPGAPEPGTGALSPEVVVIGAPEFDARRWMRTTRGLALWLLLLAGFGIGGVLLDQKELAALAAIAGLFVAAQAADLDAQWLMLHYVLVWVVPVMGAAAFVSLGIMMITQQMAGAASGAIAGVCFGSALISASTLARPVTNSLARWLFRSEAPSHTLRLAARLVLLCLLFALPGWFAVRAMLDSMGDQLGTLIESTSLGTSLLGYVLLALASVGYLLRTDLRGALARLGIGGIGARDLMTAAIGIAALFLLNSSADAIQQHFLHDLWLADQQMSEQIGGNLGVFGTLALGLSAGIGEEITMRGALQPRLGIVLTSLVFASLHVQYSWYGMLVIFVLGTLLGVIRRRSNTTTAMIVHAIYDMLAVLSIKH